MYACMRACMCVCMCVCMRTFMYVCMHACMCVYACMHACMLTYRSSWPFMAQHAFQTVTHWCIRARYSDETSNTRDVVLCADLGIQIYLTEMHVNSKYLHVHVHVPGVVNP
jgi:hypothetical protein